MSSVMTLVRKTLNRWKVFTSNDDDVDTDLNLAVNRPLDLHQYTLPCGCAFYFKLDRLKISSPYC